MPWTECSVMDERLQFGARRLAGELMTELSQPKQKGQGIPTQTAPVASWP
jgi:hypothetical protein